MRGYGQRLDALTLVLRTAVDLGRIPRGSEVILPANTYIASVLAVVHAGLVPRLLDPDTKTYNLSTDAVLRYLNAGGRRQAGAVMSVHLYGQAAEMAELAALCQEHGLFLLSDAAQAHGAMDGKPAAAFGDAAGV